MIIERDDFRLADVITHTAPHHADEVFAVAMLGILFRPMTVFRTRDENVIRSSRAIICDVGGEFDPARKRYDHHQRGFSEVRPDGIAYSSAGLIWREYGEEIVKAVAKPRKIDDEMARRVASYVDKALVKGIDAQDNGQGELGTAKTVSSVIGDYNSLWDWDEDADQGFIKACELADMILRRQIEVAISTFHGKNLVRDQIETSDGHILCLSRYVDGWPTVVLTSDSPKAADLLYAVFPAADGNWNVQAVPPSLTQMMEQRKPFPERWRGLRDDELRSVSGVKTAVFCHMAGFFAVAETKEDAIALAEKAAVC